MDKSSDITSSQKTVHEGEYATFNRRLDDIDGSDTSAPTVPSPANGGMPTDRDPDSHGFRALQGIIPADPSGPILELT